MWYKNRRSSPEEAEKPSEVVFEIVTGSDGVGCGLAVRSAPRFHEKTLETTRWFQAS
jgi:hypothetical protein